MNILKITHCVSQFSSICSENVGYANQRNILGVSYTEYELSTYDPDENSTINDNEQSNSEADTEDEAPVEAASCDSIFDGTIGIFMFTIGVLYCFVGLAIICEGEFSDSVVELAKFLKLPPDVAGKFFIPIYKIC